MTLPRGMRISQSSEGRQSPSIGQPGKHIALFQYLLFMFRFPTTFQVKVAGNVALSH